MYFKGALGNLFFLVIGNFANPKLKLKIQACFALLFTNKTCKHMALKYI